MLVVLQVIFSALVDYLMMGVVFARWVGGQAGWGGENCAAFGGAGGWPRWDRTSSRRCWRRCRDLAGVQSPPTAVQRRA
jgi:hypothetical protein